jgi:hypothetical protein
MQVLKFSVASVHLHTKEVKTLAEVSKLLEICQGFFVFRPCKAEACHSLVISFIQRELAVRMLASR